MKNRIVLFFVIIPFLLFAQNKSINDFKVQSFSLSDKLDEKSTIDPSYGKYTAFEFDINNNDHFYINVTSKDFTPYIFISSPKGKNIFAYPIKENNTVELDTVANETGKWSLYIVCDSLEQGSFKLSISFCDKKSFEIPKSKDFGLLLKFLIAHANADFKFLKSRSTNLSKSLYVSPLIFPQSIKSIINFDKKPLYEITFYEGKDEKSSEQEYLKIKKEIKDILKDGYMNKEYSKPDENLKFTKFSSINQPTLSLKYFYNLDSQSKVVLEIESKK